MQHDLYSACIGESNCIAEDVPYEALIKRIIEFTIRAAMARSTDESDWEQDELRRRGLSAIQLFHNGKAVWCDAALFERELAEARRERAATRFLIRNQLDPSLTERLERDLRNAWRAAGYQVATLLTDMKKIFTELERDVAARARDAREGLLAEILSTTPKNPVR